MIMVYWYLPRAGTLQKRNSTLYYPKGATISHLRPHLSSRSGENKANTAQGYALSSSFIALYYPHITEETEGIS